MGKGQELGRQLRHWIVDDHWVPASGQLVANRLLDLLGAEESLRAPLRDLAAQPLFLQLLRQLPRPQVASAEALRALLARTYAPAVLQELEDLIAGVSDLPLAARDPQLQSRPRPRPEPASSLAGATSAPGPISSGADPALAEALNAAAAFPPPSEAPLAAPAEPTSLTRRPDRSRLRRWRQGRWLPLVFEALRPLGAALALAFSVSLVLAWAAQELDQALLDSWGWSGGVTLALSLLLLQLLSSGPLRRLRRHALLDLVAADDPQRSWHWLTAPWFHARSGEALVNGLLLLLLLGPSPLPLEQVILRYGLTSLATLLLAVLTARELGLPQRRWGGASGAVGALIALAASLSLLHWREHSFPVGLPGASLAVPAWVLLVVYGALQLGWQLAPSVADADSRASDRLWTSTWWWGSLLGVAWAGLTWLQQQLLPLLPPGGTPPA
ncbi:MAG: rhomboid family intramembrane serine protease [Synechococcaceae cyanobacterium]|nr:rhomboid family intramembrane serine protease [Synechococcaceae cyanobacterium]